MKSLCILKTLNSLTLLWTKSKFSFWQTEVWQLIMVVIRAGFPKPEILGLLGANGCTEVYIIMKKVYGVCIVDPLMQLPEGSLSSSVLA